MKVEFLKSFSKDLDSIDSKSTKNSLIRILEKLENIEDLNKLSSLKKLKGHKNAYSIRVGDYRLGFFVEGSIVLLA